MVSVSLIAPADEQTWKRYFASDYYHFRFSAPSQQSCLGQM
jgi:hypothetical protein